MTGLFKIKCKRKMLGGKKYRNFGGTHRPCDWSTLIEHVCSDGVDRIISIQHYDKKPNENRAPLNGREMLALWQAVNAAQSVKAKSN
jgi:hypothetical protein